ncbi:hypothetical protein D2U88_16580 [Flagellimonas aequoris]|uniref:Uncharacterized protein n=1 Tax=Flagellimonas aequoris TaxID=2306997 RepID=A0A418N4N2_9FLAO|nr:hypothetical protein D2U88_16580 [Allomuricauda aequoris]
MKKLNYYLYNFIVYLITLFVVVDIFILLDYLLTIVGVMDRKIENIDRATVLFGSITICLYIVEYILRKLK